MAHICPDSPPCPDCHVDRIEFDNKTLRAEVADLTRKLETALDGRAYWQKQAENQLNRVKEVHAAWEATKLQVSDLQDIFRDATARVAAIMSDDERRNIAIWMRQMTERYCAEKRKCSCLCHVDVGAPQMTEHRCCGNQNTLTR